MDYLEKWTFGDGSIFNGNAPAHLYPMPGVYTPSLTIYDPAYPTVVVASKTKELHITALAWWSEFSVAITNKCYRFGTSPQEGLGVSEVSGEDWVRPTSKVQPIRIKDESGVYRSIIFDAKDRGFYEITSNKGAKRTPIWRDKSDVNGDNGSTYSGGVALRGATGELNRFFVEMLSTNVYSRPIDNLIKGTYQYDSGSYPTDLLINVAVSDSDNVEEPIQLAQKISLPNHEVVFDKRVEARFIQTSIEWNVAPFQFIGFTQNIIAKDKLDYTTKRIQPEETWQEELASLKSWFTRGNNLILNLVTGFPADTTGTISFTEGVDGFSDSAIAIEAGATLTLPIQGDILFWYRDDTPIASLPSTLQVISIKNNWVLARVDNFQFVLNEGTYEDIRVYEVNSISEDAIKYLYDDMNLNFGNKTLPLWG